MSTLIASLKRHHYTPIDMRTIVDIHLHSKWSRACSKNLTLPNIAKACEKKGIDLVGTADALHPAWHKDIASLLEETDEKGVFRLNDGSSKTSFLLSTEVSCIYKKNDKVRRVHHLLLFSSLRGLEKFIATLNDRAFNIKSDGRPILGLDSQELFKMLLDADPEALLIPAHAWTPWFAIFGSQSGFDSLEECFGEMANQIYAIETGLSSDPLMNWRLSQLDRVFLVSNSDAHSLQNLGREANVFEMKAPSYREFRRILMEHDTSKFLETIEFFPEEGKYHADGHRACGYWCTPEQTKKIKGLCPKCGKPLTVGVLHRVADLADRPPSPPRPPRSVPYRSIVPLAEIVASTFDVAPKSKKVETAVQKMTDQNASEFSILLDISESELQRLTTTEIAAAIIAVREGRVDVEPGYDGEYGVIKPKSGHIKPRQHSLGL